MKPVFKRIITTICIACLMLIDLKAGNDSWYIWIITDNMVGVVFAVLMFTAYPLKEYTRPFYIVWSILGFLSVIGSGVFWYTHQIGHILGYWITVPVNIWFLGIIFFKYVEKIFITRELKIRFAKWEYVFIACMILMLLSKSDYVWPFYYMAIFLMLWHLPFSNEDKNQIFIGVLDGLLAGFIILQGSAFMNKSYALIRYTGAYWNSNRNGALYLLIFTTFLAKILLYKKKKDGDSLDAPRSQKDKLDVKVWLMFFLSALIAALVMYTGSRSALMGMAIILAVYFIIVERRVLCEKKSKIFLQFSVFVIMIAVAMPLMYFPICYLPLITGAVRNGISNITKGTNLPVAISAEGSVQFDEALDNMVIRFLRSDIKHKEGEVSDEKDTDEEETPYVFDIESYDSDPDYYVIEYYFRDYPEKGKKVIFAPRYLYSGVTSMNIRINFFSVLISNMNLTGHPGSEVFMVIASNAPGTSVDWLNNEQNFMIHYLYAYGVPVGILFCTLIFAELIYLLRLAFKGRADSFIFAMFILVYICIGMMEVVWIPGQILFILLFVSPFFFNMDYDDKLSNGRNI